MVEVELPDGTILEFPADMPREAIEAASRKQWARMNMSTGEDVARSAGSGALRGTVGLADLPSLARAAGNSGLGWAADKIGAEGVADWFRERGLQNPENYGRADRITRDLGGGAALDYDPTTTAGEFTQTTAEFVAPGLITGGIGGALSKGSTAARGAAATILPSVTGGIGSEAAGQATEGTVFEPWARLGGGILGGMAPTAVQRLASPGGVPNAYRQQQVQTLKDAGIDDLTAGQITGNTWLQGQEARSLQAATGHTGSKLQDQTTRAFLRTIGVDDATQATEGVMDDAATAIGSMFDDATRGIPVRPDKAATTAMARASAKFFDVADSPPRPIFNKVFAEFMDAQQGNKILDAKRLKEWRTTLNGLRKDPDKAVRDLAADFIDALDDTYEAAAVAAGRPEVVPLLRDARAKYKNLLVLEDALSRAGSDTASGFISPSAVRSAVARMGKRAYVGGKAGPLGDIAKAAEAIIKPLPTTLAAGVRNIPGMDNVVGAAVAGVTGMGAVPAAAMIAAPTIARTAAMTKPMQSWLARQSANRGSYAEGLQAVMPGLLGQVGGR